MAEEKGRQSNLSRYREDVRTIREVLMTVHRRPLFANWVFFTWGGILSGGAVIHYVVSRRMDWLPMQEFLRLWLPLIAVGLSLEMTAYVRNSRKHGLPLWTRDFARVVSGMVGSSMVLVFLVVVLFQAGAGALVPTVLLLGLAVLFFLFGQHPSYPFMSMIGFLALAGAVSLYLFQPDKAVAGLMCGIVAGVCMAIAGVIGGRPLHAV